MGIYEKLGVKKVVNCLGTVTVFGGSVMDPRVLEAMDDASKSFVHIPTLHRKASERIAKLLGAPGACITAGAAAGLGIAAAASVTGIDKDKILQLPDTTGLRDEIIMIKCHRILYDQGARLSGCSIKEVGVTSFVCKEQIEAAISERTACFLYIAEAEPLRGSISIEDVLSITGKYDIPVIVDAAAEIPPTSNILKYLNSGADMVVFSGGKELRGPQSSGIILCKGKYIEPLALNCCPNYSIGRAMKIDKETIAGILTAVELFVEKDYQDVFMEWNEMVDRVVSELSDIENIVLSKGTPIEPGIQPPCIPRAYIELKDGDTNKIKNELMSFDPAICIGIEYGNKLAVNPQCLDISEVDYVIEKLREIL